MANVKISDLPAASSAAGSDQLETNQSGTSRRLTVAQVAAHVRSTATDTLVAAAGSAAAPSISPTGDSNTGIYFPGADRIGFAEGGAQCGEFDASGNFLFNSGYGSVARAFGCRAWVNFNGTGTVAIRASGNVSSITDNGVGFYTVNFANAMPDANYCVNGVTTWNTADTSGSLFATSTQFINVGSVTVYAFQTNSLFNFVDSHTACVAIFR